MERPSSSHFSFQLRRCALLGSTFFVVMALAAPSLASAPLPDDALVEAGIAKLQANAIDAALTLFAQAEKSAPRDPRPHFLRATALLKQKTPDAPGAIKSYRAALALDPKLARVHNELGAALLDAGQADEARKEWKAAVAADPTLGEAWYNLAKAERAHGDSDAASASFKTAMRLLPGDADVRIDYSLLLRKMGKITESLAAAREAVSLDTASGPAHVNLAFVLRAAGLLDDAQAELTVATRLAPEDAIAWWELGNVERERKKAAPARKALETAYRLKPSPSITADLVSLLVEQGDAPHALDVLRAQVAKSPRSLALRMVLARTLAADKKCPEAQAALAELPAGPKVFAVVEEIKKACAAAKGSRDPKR